MHPYIASPYREDVSAEAIYTDAGECWEVFDRVTYICKRAGTGIQQEVAFRVDRAEYESLDNFQIDVVFPYTHNEPGKTVTLHGRENPKPKFGERFVVPLTQFKDVDGLLVIATHNYRVRKERFQYWTMSHPSKNFRITLRYPDGYKVQWKPMVLSPDLIQTTEADGYFSATYDFWMLPESGMAWLITKKQTNDDDRTSSSTALPSAGS